MEPKIEIYQSDSQIVRDAIDKVIVKVYQRKREKNHRSFLLTGCSAGCGTTHTAINMAVALANAGWKTVLVDCDIRKGMTYKRLNQEVNNGLSDYLMKQGEKPVFPTDIDKLYYIPCGNNVGSPVRLLCTKEMETLVRELNDEYDFVIYDFPSIEIVPDAGIMMSVVDDVILVAAVNETSKQQLDSAKSKVKACKDKYLGLILNKLELPEYRHYVKNYDYFRKDLLVKKHAKDMKKIRENTNNGENEKESSFFEKVPVKDIVNHLNNCKKKSSTDKEDTVKTSEDKTNSDKTNIDKTSKDKKRK